MVEGETSELQEEKLKSRKGTSFLEMLKPNIPVSSEVFGGKASEGIKRKMGLEAISIQVLSYLFLFSNIRDWLLRSLLIYQDKHGHLVMYMFVLRSCQTYITVHLSTPNFFNSQSK